MVISFEQMNLHGCNFSGEDKLQVDVAGCSGNKRPSKLERSTPGGGLLSFTASEACDLNNAEMKT